LERNRQAALKCRQRKKAWLASLQARVEYLSTENERLASALVSSREEISRLSALVGGAVIGPGGPTVGPGVVPPTAMNAVVSSGQPVSMSMNMTAKGGGTGSGPNTRPSYGY
jgi:ATF/CREB family transcription factor